MSMVETAPPSSFMKAARAHYRLPGGKLLAGLMLMLFAALVALVLKADMLLLGAVSPQRTVTLVLVILVVMLCLMFYAVQDRARKLWTRAHDGVIGNRLQSRIILMFTGIAIVPTIIVAGFSILFFNVGVKSWFDTQVAAALEDSVAVATAYVEEHKESIRNAAVSMGEAVHEHGAAALNNPAAYTQFLTQQSAQRNLSEAVVFNRDTVLARSSLSFSLTFERFDDNVFSRADDGQVAVFSSEEDNKIQAVVKISSAPSVYLLVTRVVDPKVIAHMKSALETVDDYHQLEADLAKLQKQFFVVFVLVALIIVMTSLWAGILLAVRLIEPLRALMLATEHVRGGDYSIRVPEGRADDEIANLGRTFNRMTGQLESGRRDLMDANRIADERRRFTEAVLSGVSAGVIALDNHERITLHNRRALELLGRENIELGGAIQAILPELKPLIEEARLKPERSASANLSVQHAERRLTLHAQVTAEQFGSSIEGYIVTFDDMTALVSAQRSAAWADVARRIAHEIKNPLTPITLSVERIRKKYAPAESAERESFDKYIETISRHTRDIGKMVEEFVAYARMPTTVFKPENLTNIIKKAVFSEQTAHPDITYQQSLPAEPVMLNADEAQLGRALLNLLKNAAEAMEAATPKTITLSLSTNATHATLTIDDTGPGFPADKIATLTEPYVTTRAKGTGLGLAIVKRTVEEHKGTLTLTNREGGGGARVVVVLPLVQ